MKKNVKKILSLILVLALLLTAYPFALAATPQFSVELSSDSVSAETEQTITMTLTAGSAIEMMGIQFTVTYDNALTLVDIVPGAGYGSNFGGSKNLDESTAMWYSSDAENYNVGTELAVITFTVPAGTVAGSYNVGIESLTMTADYGDTILADGASAATTLTVADNTPAPSHTCNWTYALDSDRDTLTATCTGEGTCDSGANTTLTLVAPEHKIINDGKAAVATFTNNATSIGGITVLPAIQYHQKDPNSFGDFIGVPTTTPPTNSGQYRAFVTIEGKTVLVDYTIQKLAREDIKAFTVSDITSNSFVITLNEDDWGKTDFVCEMGSDKIEFTPDANGKATITVPAAWAGSSEVWVSVYQKETDTYKKSNERIETISLQPEAAPSYTVTVTARPAEGGTVTGGGTYEENSGVTVTATPNEGYKFVNWTLGGVVYSTDASYTFMALSNRDLVANFEQVTVEPETYTITFDPANGEDVLRRGYEAERGYALPAAPVKTGYTFGGWQLSGGGLYQAGSSYTATADATFTAQWTINSYTISWDTNGDGFVDDTTIADYGSTPAHADGAKDADEKYTYTFTGWSPAIVEVTGNATYTAQFSSTAKSYTVTLNTDGGTVNSGDVTSYTYGVGATLPTDVTKTGSNFGGWYDNSECTGFAVTSISIYDSGAKEYWAKWIVNGYSVTFNTDGGSAVANQVVEHDGKVTEPAEPTKTGYSFAGWYSDSNLTTEYDFESAVTASITLYAKWTINSYTVIWIVDGVEDVDTYEYDSAITAPAEPTKTGYSFEGWDAEIPATMPAENLTFTAQWAVESYGVVLNTNDGTIANGKDVTSYTYGIGAALPVAADITKVGFEFDGWYDNAEFAGEVVTAIGTDTTGDKTFYAKWNVVYYDIYVDGVQITGENLVIDSNDSANIANGTATYNPTNNTLTLNGFTANANGPVLYASNDIVVEVVGTNTLIGVTGIKADSNLTIKGSGTLNVTGDEAGVLAENGTVTFDNVTITTQATAGKAVNAANVVMTYSYGYKWKNANDDELETGNIDWEKVDAYLYVEYVYGGFFGGVSAEPTYGINVVTEGKGTAKVSNTSASKGDTIVITVTPNTGYELISVTVADKNSKVIETVVELDGTYTFVMPASKVTVTAEFAMINPFIDVDADAYYYDSVLWAVENGITDGTGATTFSPNADCTRAQIVTFLWRAAGCPAPVNAENPFIDVVAGTYYYDAVLWAVEKGITDGISDTAFAPDSICTRAQIVTFLYRFGDAENGNTSNPFADVAENAYYYDAVLWAVENGVTDGMSETIFAPADECTRAQTVVFLYRSFGK